MKKFTKTFLILMVTLLTGFLLVACTGDTTLEDTVSELTYATILASGDTKDKVTKNLNLITKKGDVEITWASSDRGTISTAGVVVRPDDADKVVVLTATLTYKKKSDSVNLSVTVLKKAEDVDPDPDPDPEEFTTIAQFKAMEEAATATIKGVVTSLAPYNSFGLEDASGAVAFRISGKNSANIDFAVGDTITADVKKALYNGLIQAEYVAEGKMEVEKTASSLPTPIDISSLALTPEVLLPHQSKLATLNNVVVIERSISATAVELKLENLAGEKIAYRWDNRLPGDEPAFLANTKVGDIVSVKGAVITWFNAPQLAGENNTQLVAGTSSPELLVIADKALANEDLKAIELVLSHTEAGTLDLVVEGINKSVIVWTLVTGDATLINLDTGVFTMPDETGALVLKATVTKGATTVTKDFTVNLVVVIAGETLEFHETFDTSTAAASYGDFTFVGVNETNWTATHSRDEDTYGIDGDGIMLRRNSDSTLTGVISGGLESFSVDYMKAFTGKGNRPYIITLTDGVTSHEFNFPDFGSEDNGVKHNLTKDNLGLVGEVTVVIKGQTDSTTNAQVTIDNFKWTQIVPEV